MQDNIFTDWLHRRKISDSIIKEFDIHFGKHKVIGECIIIPVNDENGIFSFNKYRRNPTSTDTPKYIYDVGGRSTLYGADRIKNNNTVVVVEGELDALVCWSHNIPAVSSTGGTMTFLKEWADLLKDKEVTLCFDNDEAGGNGMARVFDLIPNAKIMFLPDRPGIKDISDFVTNGGDIHALLKTAKSFQGLEEVMEDKSARQAIFQSTYFHDSYIKNHTKPTYARKELDPNIKDKVVRAKAYPIDEIIQFKEHKACCIWHNEKTSSMHYYEKTNTVYCFGCGKFGDSISVYRQINNCTFTEAVKALQ